MAYSLREFASVFSASRALQVPLIITAVVSLIFAVPPQTIELYASVAQDVVFAGGPFNAFDDSDGRHALAVIVFGAVSTILLGVAIWASAQSLGAERERRAGGTTDRVGKATVRWLARCLASLPIAAIGLGLLTSAYYTPTPRFKAGLENIFRSLGQNAEHANAWARKIDSVGHGLWVAGWAHIAAAVAFIVILWAVERYLQRHDRNDPNTLGTRWTLRALVGFAFVGAAILFLPISLWRWVGAVGLISLFFACLTIFSCNLFRSSLRSGYPILTGIVLCALIFAALGLNDNHRLSNVHVTAGTDDSARTETELLPDLASHFKTWLESRPDRARFTNKGARYPVYVVAAQGGGIYAAYHTALALANLQDLCPAFASHLFAISSVSGGSLGGTAFRAALGAEAGKNEPCEDKDVWPLAEAVAKVLDADYVSPLVGYLLFPDLMQRFIPYPIDAFDRAIALERVFIEQTAQLPGNKADVLRQSYLRHWNPTGNAPAMLFNTTEVVSGRRRVVSPFNFPSKEISFLPLWEKSGALSPSLAVAAIVSARSPWLTPSAWFEETEPQSGEGKARLKRIRLVDGGYFENSGVSTAHDLVRALDRQLAALKLNDQVEVFLLVFTSPDVDDDFSAQPFTDILDPIRTLLNTRSARARAAIERAEEDLGAYTHGSVALPRVRRFPLESLGLQLPLGWRISGATKIMIEMQIGDFKRCPGSPNDKTELGERFEADCVVRQIFEELNAGQDASAFPERGK